MLNLASPVRSAVVVCCGGATDDLVVSVLDVDDNRDLKGVFGVEEMEKIAVKCLQ